MVTSGIFSLLHEYFIVHSLFCMVAGDVPFPLLGNHIVDNGFFAFEVIADGFQFIGRFPLLEDRSSLFCSGWVFRSVSV